MKTYFTLDNGARPFRVTVDADCVRVYKAEENEDYEFRPRDYSILVNTFEHPQHVWLGWTDQSYENFGPSHTKKAAKKYALGNTILLQTKAGKYVCIGRTIFTFSLPKSEKFVKFVAYLGNNDVPYPSLRTNKNIYMLINGTKSIPYAPVEDFGILIDDPYQVFYGHQDKEGNPSRYKISRPMTGVSHLKTKVL